MELLAQPLRVEHAELSRKILGMRKNGEPFNMNLTTAAATHLELELKLDLSYVHHSKLLKRFADVEDIQFYIVFHTGCQLEPGT